MQAEPMVQKKALKRCLTLIKWAPFSEPFIARQVQNRNCEIFFEVLSSLQIKISCFDLNFENILLS